MTKVFTGNVFATISKTALENVFFHKEKLFSFKNIIENLSERDLLDSYIVTPYRNSSLVELEYSFITNDNSRLVMRLLETNNLFELLYANSSPISAIMENVIREMTQNNIFSAEDKKDILEDILAGSNSRTLYFSFGMSDDLREWGGPFMVTLSKASILNSSDGVKMVELEFLGPPSPLSRYNPVEFFKGFGIDNAITRFNRVFQKNDYITISASIKRSDASRIDYDIRDLITKYIQGVSKTKNVLVFLPLIKSYIEKARKSKAFKLNVKQKTYTQESKDEYERQRTNYKILNDIERKVQGLFGEPPKDTIYLSNFLRPTAQLVQEDISVEEVLKQLGIRIEKPSKYINLAISPIYDVNNEVGIDPSFMEEYFVMGNTFQYSTKYSDNQSIALTPLYKFIDGLRLIDDFSGEICLFEETNIKTLKLWKKYGFIEDEYSPAFIFGDAEEVKNALYLENAFTLEDALNLDFQPLEYNKKFYDKGYRLDYFNLYKKDIPNSSFGEDVFKPDELALDSNTAKVFKGLNIPIFRHNLPNPNVLGLEVNFDSNYAILYSDLLAQKTEIPLYNHLTDLILSGDNGWGPSKEGIVDFVNAFKLAKGKDLNPFSQEAYDSILKFINERSSRSDENTIDSNFTAFRTPTSWNAYNLKGLDRRDFAKFIQILLYLDFYKDREKGMKLVSQNAFTPERMKAVIDELHRLVISINIKTLPFFGLKTPFNKRCLLISNTNSVIGNSVAQVKSQYSGIYSIMGFKHFLSTKEIYSEFNLIPDHSNSYTTTVTVKQGINTIAKRINGKVVDIK